MSGHLEEVDLGCEISSMKRLQNVKTSGREIGMFRESEEGVDRLCKNIDVTPDSTPPHLSAFLLFE